MASDAPKTQPARRRHVSVAILGLVGFAVIAWFIWPRPADPNEPLVGGVPISKWLRSGAAVLGSSKPGTSMPGNTNIIPFLIQAAKSRDFIPISWRAWVWQKLPPSLQAKLSPPVSAALVRMAAFQLLRRFGPEAEPALDVVIAAAKNDPDVMTRNFALQTAVAINPNHPEVLELLERGLRSNDALSRTAVSGALLANAVFPRSLTNLMQLNFQDMNRLYFNDLLVLGALGPEVTPFIPRILPFLASDKTAGNALTALRQVGPAGIAALPALVDCLQSSQIGIRADALVALISMGPAANAALPAVETALQDKAQTIRVLAAVTRWRITGETEPSATIMLAVLNTKTDASHWSLGQRRFGLENFGFDSKQTALWFFGDFGPAARAALPDLTKQMEKGGLFSRVAAARAVWKVDGANERPLAVLKEGIGSPMEYVRNLSCYIAGEMGPAAAPLLPDLEAAAAATLQTRRVALDAIRSIRQNPPSDAASPAPVR